MSDPSRACVTAVVLASTACITGCSAIAHPWPAEPALPATHGLGRVSAFEGYRAFNEQAMFPWGEANQQVGRIGGWKAYARQAQGEAPTAPPAPPPTGHGGPPKP